MATKQESYRAFMESVCNKFNCKEALPALTEGFNAFCEATFETWASRQPWTSEYDQVIPPHNDHPGFQSVSKYFIVRRGDKYNVVRAYVAGLDEPTKASPISKVWFDRVEQVGRTPFNNEPKYRVQLGSATLIMNCFGCLYGRGNSFGKPTSEDELMDRLRKVDYPV